MADPTPPATISVKVEFGGGLELLFDNKRKFSIDLPTHVASGSAGGPSTVPSRPNEDKRSAVNSTETESLQEQKPVDVAFLIRHISSNLLVDKRRTDLFEENGTV